MRPYFFAVLIVLAGCGSSKTEQETEDDGLIIDARMAVEDQLRDPSSAQFSGVIVSRVSGLPVVCGLVNARNGFGGYVGARPFIFTGDGALIASPENIEQFKPIYEAGCRS